MVAVDRMLVSTDIAEQPEALARLVDGEVARRAREVAQVIRERSPRFVLLAARGSGDHAAQYAKYLVELALGLPAGMASPSTMTAYGARPDLSDVLVLCLSRRGDSCELTEMVATARAGGATTLAVTSASDCPLAEVSELHLNVLDGHERSVVATKSYLAQMLGTWLVFANVRGIDPGMAAPLPVAAARMVDRWPEVAALATRFKYTDRIVTTGRGYSYPTAREAALKLVEVAHIGAHAYSGADLVHGPLAMIEHRHPVIAIVPDGHGATAMEPVLDRLADRGADVTVFGGTASVERGTIGFDLGVPGVAEELHPIIDAIPLQILAVEIAAARGLDPDAPRSAQLVADRR